MTLARVLKSLISTIGKLIALGLASLVALTLASVLLLNGFERTILQPNFWKEALAEGDFYAAGLPDAVVDMLLGAIWPEEDSLGTVLPAAKLQPLITAWIPPHWFQTQTESFIDAVFA